MGLEGSWYTGSVPTFERCAGELASWNHHSHIRWLLAVTLEVTELEKGLYRLENSGGFMADLLDYGDILQLEHVGGNKYLLKERTASSHRRFDFILARGTDLSRPELVAYLERVLYWERSYGGWLCMFVDADSPLQPDVEFAVLLQRKAIESNG